jgi:hypothetical protein
MRRLRGIQGQVELEDIDARLAQQSKLSAFRLFGHEATDDALVHPSPSRARHAADLIVGSGRADVGIEAAS